MSLFVALSVMVAIDVLHCRNRRSYGLRIRIKEPVHERQSVLALPIY
jgi:hypothetical protein